jgi:hypothetical protein
LATVHYFADKIDRVDDLYGSIGIAIVMLLFLFLLARTLVVAQFLNAGLAGRGNPLRSARAVGENGRDHHGEPQAADDVVGQVSSDVHPPETGGSHDPGEDRAGGSG